ncbi:MAG TPA: tetratricopeptide repeat protein, partial [bacterium]|nr:tetratricopeptide repeat protein [bacterium]
MRVLNRVNLLCAALLAGIAYLGAVFCLAQDTSPSVLDQFKTHYLNGEYDQAEALLKQTADESLKNGNQKDASDLLYRLGFLYDRVGKFDQAMGAYGDSQQLARIVGDQSLVVKVAFNSAATSLSLGDAKRALAIYQGLLEAFEAAGAEEAKARCLQNRGAVLMQQGELSPAYKDLTEALKIYESKNSQGRIAETVTNLGILLTREGLYDQAKDQFERAAAIFTASSDQRSLATVLINQAELAQKQGDAATALQLLDKALQAKKATQDRMGEAAALQVIAQTLYSQGEHQKALDTLGQSLALRVELKDVLGEGSCHLLMGEWLFRIGGAENFQKAEVHLSRAYDAFKNAGYKQYLQRVLYWQGRISDARGNVEQAEKKFNEAITELESLTYRLPDDVQATKVVSTERSEPYEALVSLLIRQNRLPEALAYLDRSRDQNLAKDLIGGTSEEISYQSRIAALRERIEQAKSEKDTKLAEMLAKEAEGVQD